MVDLQNECKTLRSLEEDGTLARLVDAHERKAQLKTPAQLLERMPQQINLSPEAAAMIVLNVTTETGLPHFHRLLSTHLGEEGALRQWTDIWTAEEHRHEVVLLRILERVDCVSMHEVDLICHKYLKVGFRPNWQRSPYRLLAYTVLQEQATQRSYAGILPMLTLDMREVHQVMRAISAEEQKHHNFYLALLKAIYLRDPRGVILALRDVDEHFAMPGQTMPGFKTLAWLAARRNVYSREAYGAILRATLQSLGLGDIRDDCGLEAQGAQEQLHKSIQKSGERHARLLALRAQKVEFPFIRDWSAAV